MLLEHCLQSELPLYWKRMLGEPPKERLNDMGYNVIKRVFCNTICVQYSILNMAPLNMLYNQKPCIRLPFCKVAI